MGDVIWLMFLPLICGAFGGVLVVLLMVKPTRRDLPTWANHRDWKGE